jgi:ribosomal protein L2
MSSGAEQGRPSRVIVLDATDNVSIALVDLDVGETVQSGQGSVPVREPIPSGHKLALTEIPLGGPIIKYGEVIGLASSPILQGSHVHVHNVTSGRLPGPDR